MAGGSIRTADLETMKRSGIGPGAILVDCLDLTPEGFLKVLKNDPTAQGRHIGGMTAAPNFQDSDEKTDRTENLVGVTTRLVGADHRVRTDVMISVEIAKMTEENFKLIRPDFVTTDWMSGGATPERVGKRYRRSGEDSLDHYLKNVVLLLPVQDSTIGYAFVVENAKNTSDDAEHSPEDDGNIYGVSCEFSGHADGTQMDLESGQFQIPFEILEFELPVAA